MFWFKKKMSYIQIQIRPMAGLGADRKGTMKFASKFFRKCGNWEAVKTEIQTARINGTLSIYAKVPASVARKIEKQQAKLGFDIEVSPSALERMGKKLRNVVKYYEDKKKSWVASSF